MDYEGNDLPLDLGVNGPDWDGARSASSSGGAGDDGGNGGVSSYPTTSKDNETTRPTARGDTRELKQVSNRKRRNSESGHIVRGTGKRKQHMQLGGQKNTQHVEKSTPLSQDAGDENGEFVPAFEIIQDKTIRKWKYGVEEKAFKVKFDEDKAGERLVDVRAQLVAMFDAVIKEAGRNYSKQDKARMTIFHNSMQTELFVHLQNIENLSGQSVMDRFERVLNSHEEMRVDSSFQISVGLLKMKKGGVSHRLALTPHLNSTAHSAVVNKRSIVEVVCGEGEQICAGKAVEILVARKSQKMCQRKFNLLVRKSRQSSNRRKGLKARALSLLAKSGLPSDRALTIPELAKMEKVVQAKILVVTHGACGPHILQCSDSKKYEMNFFLYHTSDHFHAVVNPNALFKNSAICYTCFEIYKLSEKKQHPCLQKDQKCFACGRVECQIEERMECEDCKITFRNQGCFDSHLKSTLKRGGKEVQPLCQRRKKCANCAKVIYVNKQRIEDHVCGTYMCRHCNKWVDSSHLCYLRRKKMLTTSGKFIFFDFESVTDQMFQCREGYRAKNPQGCGGCEGTEESRGRESDFGVSCNDDDECVEGISCNDDGECCGAKSIGEGYNARCGVEGSMCGIGNLCKQCRMCKNCGKSQCGRNQHQPNLVVAESCCDSCKDIVLESGSTCYNCGDICDTCWKNKRSARQGNRMGKGKEEGECAGMECQVCPVEGCGRRRVVLKGFDTVFKFCTWLFTPKHAKFTVMAHYGKGYDFMFLLNWLVTEACITPEVIFSGSKIMSLEVKEGLSIRCVDSLNFMLMPLKKLPEAFGLKPEQLGVLGCDVEELTKLDFPHAFNTRDRWDYVGPYPPLEMYDLESKSESERERIRGWHAKQDGKTFNLQDQLEHYCIIDTSILRLACMTFRDMIKSITLREVDDGTVTYVDCFSHLTMASCVMQIYRLNHIEEYHDITLGDGRSGVGTFRGGEWFMDGKQVPTSDIVEKSFASSTIPQLPAQGYVRSSNHSLKSIGWLEIESKKIGRQIVHARNVGEHKIICGPHKYSVDGYDKGPEGDSSKGVVYEFLGCYFHGHFCMKDRKNLKDPRTQFSMAELNRQTLERIERIKSMGYKVKSIYECQFDKIIEGDPNLALFLKELDIPPRMNTRMAFYGGRTSGFKLHHKVNENIGEEIHYLDVCSLYPFINKHKRLPLGHPRIITSGFDMTIEDYFGIAHALVLPPQDEYICVLPYRSRGKLHFPLCRTCCDSANQGRCGHNADDRAIPGVWCTPELQEAVRSGYKILKLYEVYQYDKSSKYDMNTREGGLFARQVDLFLKLKAQASGYPSWVHSPSDENKFVARFEDKTGIRLEKCKIEVNPALRSISKLCLNAFWGKLGQRSNMSRSSYIKSSEELDKIVSNSAIEVTNFHIVSEDVLVLEFKKAKFFEEESAITNDVLAAFTTCHARLELLRHIRTVGADNILYVDTDSIIFKTRRVDGEGGKVTYENYPVVGDSLGELTNELPKGVHIVEFCCSAPKSYAFRTSDGRENCKFKGVTLHTKNTKRINFKAVKQLIFGEKSSISLEPETQFHRSKFNGVITNTKLEKTISHTFDKRRVLGNLDTVPYGFTSE